MRYLLGITLAILIHAMGYNQNLSVFRSGKKLTSGATLKVKYGQRISFRVELITANLNMDDIDRFPDDTGDWVDSTTSGGDTMIETLEWTADAETIFDFFDFQGDLGPNAVQIPVKIVDFEPGVINADGSGEFSNVVVTDSIDENSVPVAGKLYKNSLPLAYGLIQFDGTILTNYGIDSIDVINQGLFCLYIKTPPRGFPVAIVTPVSNSAQGDRLIPTVKTYSDDTRIEVNIKDESNNNVNADFMIVVFANGRNEPSIE